MSDKSLTTKDLSSDQRDVYDGMMSWAVGTGQGPSEKTLLAVGGFAGTGKTSILGVFAKALQKEGLLVAYAAYTGRAASILRRKLAAAGVETTSQLRRTSSDARSGWDGYFSGELGEHSGPPLCGTVHKLLYRPVIDAKTEELQGWMKRDELDRRYDLVIVDEASMVSDEILEDIQGHGVPLLAVGDHGQLPPVMATGELMKHPNLRLEKIHRQAEGNPIIALSRLVREGGTLDAFKGWGKDVVRGAKGSHMQEILDAYEATAENSGELRSRLDVGLLCWMNKTRVRLNATARTALKFKGAPRKGEVLIALKNKPPVFNGMRGILSKDSKLAPTPWLLEAEVGFPDEGIDSSPFTLCAPQFNREKAFDSVEELRERGLDVYSMSAAGTLMDFGYAMTVHKCVDPATLVETPEGLVRAGELKEAGSIAGPYGEVLYRNRVDYGPGTMLEILTEDGYALRVTEDHGVDVWDSYLGYAKMLASKIRPGHVVRLKLGATFRTGGDNKLPNKRPQDVRARDYDLPKSCGADEAEFFGLMVADGTVYKSGFRLAKRHEDVADRFYSLCRNMFGAAPSRFFTLGAHHVEVNSTLIAGWLRDVGGMAPNAKAIPSVILAAPIEVQAAFLRGLFEDATVNVTEDGRLDHIEFSSVFDDLHRVVRVMLLRFGIVAGSTPSRPESLYIYGRYARIFGDVIGFVSSYKQKRLESGNLGEGTRYTLPLLESEMALSTSGRPEIQRHRANGLQFDERKLFHHSAVVSIRHYTGPSVCVEVPAGHRFLQDGFSGWNSQGSQFEHVVLFLDRPEKPWEEDYRRWCYTAITRASKRLTVLR